MSLDNPFTITDLAAELEEIRAICPPDMPIEIVDEQRRRYEIIDVWASTTRMVLEIRPRSSS
jgi:hypothetical protein